MDIDVAYSYLKSMKLNADGQDTVIKLMNNRYGMTKWGLINGITEVAQDYTLDRREELEAAAGNILQRLNKYIWLVPGCKATVINIGRKSHGD